MTKRKAEVVATNVRRALVVEVDDAESIDIVILQYPDGTREEIELEPDNDQGEEAAE